MCPFQLADWGEGGGRWSGTSGPFWDLQDSCPGRGQTLMESGAGEGRKGACDAGQMEGRPADHLGPCAKPGSFQVPR